jgi:hypothetical protein
MRIAGRTTKITRGAEGANDDLVTLQQLAAYPGVQIFLQGVNISTTAHKFPFNVAIHYLKEHHRMPIEEGWFILTTLPTLTTAVQVYATRFQLEERRALVGFPDVKSATRRCFEIINLMVLILN